MEVKMKKGRSEIVENDNLILDLFFALNILKILFHCRNSLVKVSFNTFKDNSQTNDTSNLCTMLRQLYKVLSNVLKNLI